MYELGHVKKVGLHGVVYVCCVGSLVGGQCGGLCNSAAIDASGGNRCIQCDGSGDGHAGRETWWAIMLGELMMGMTRLVVSLGSVFGQQG